MEELKKTKVLFYVQHLHGVGHVFRSCRIVEALVQKGFDVSMVWGGRQIQGMELPEIPIYFLPSLYCEVTDYHKFFDENNKPVGEKYLEDRKEKLLSYVKEVDPDIVITETFPFGRRQMSFEVIPLLNALKKETLVVSSIRDIVQQNRKHISQQFTARMLKDFFHMVLVHGDSSFVKLEETVPGLDFFTDKVFYSGVVVPEIKKNVKPDEVPEVLVSAGGGAAGKHLMKVSMDVALSGETPFKKWLFSTGPYLEDNEFRELKAFETQDLKVVRFVEGFASLMKQVDLSISLAGYNTVADIIRNETPSILVPSISGKETEQLFRAQKMDAKKWAYMIHPEQLNQETLTKACMDLEGLKIKGSKLAINGAEESAKIIHDVYFSGKNRSKE